MHRVVLDTNFLIIALKFRIDIFQELSRVLDVRFDVYILDKTINELEKLINKPKVNQFTINLVKSFIKRKNIKILRTSRNGYVDDLILSLKPGNLIVATQDKELKRKLKEKNIPIIIIRQKKYLELI